MVVRDSKGKPRKRKVGKLFDKQLKAEALLASKLQEESLKVHGGPLDPDEENPPPIPLPSLSSSDPKTNPAIFTFSGTRPREAGWC